MAIFNSYVTNYQRVYTKFVNPVRNQPIHKLPEGISKTNNLTLAQVASLEANSFSSFNKACLVDMASHGRSHVH
jgi:hypothetical protein